MKFIYTLLLLMFTWHLPAQELPKPISNRQMVHDFTGLFSPQQQAVLEQQLRTFHDTTSTQIAVAVVSSLQGMEPNSYAQQLAEKWGIGQRGKDNGILIVIKPKTQQEKGQVAIAVGYGLEGVVPDAIAARIIRNEMIPEFQQNDYYRGTLKAALVLMQLTAGEFTAQEYAKKGEGQSGFPLSLLFLLFFFLLFIRRRRGYTTGSRGDTVPPIFIGGWGSSRGSDFDSFSSGSGNFGGFGGFGGGSFGGGGASGSW